MMACNFLARDSMRFIKEFGNDFRSLVQVFKSLSEKKVFDFGPRNCVRICVRHTEKTIRPAAFTNKYIGDLRFFHYRNHQPCGKTEIVSRVAKGLFFAQERFF
jgi:hypothetical protein